MNKKDIFKITILIVLIYLAGVFTPIAINNVKKEILKAKVIYKVRVDVEKINLRPEIDLNSDIIREVYKDEEFEVVKYYEGNAYNWYQVLYEEGKTGWLASGKENAWVVVVNE